MTNSTSRSAITSVVVLETIYNVSDFALIWSEVEIIVNHGLHFVEMHNLTRDGWKAFISVKDNVNLTFTRLKDKLAQASNNTFVESKRDLTKTRPSHVNHQNHWWLKEVHNFWHGQNIAATATATAGPAQGNEKHCTNECPKTAYPLQTTHCVHIQANVM